MSSILFDKRNGAVFIKSIEETDVPMFYGFDLTLFNRLAAIICCNLKAMPDDFIKQPGVCSIIAESFNKNVGDFEFIGTVTPHTLLAFQAAGALLDDNVVDITSYSLTDLFDYVKVCVLELEKSLATVH